MSISTAAIVTEEDKAMMELIRQHINADEFITTLLELANIRSIAGYEKDAGEYVYQWMKKEGFNPRKVGMVEDRFNVIGTYGGEVAGAGKNLLFTSHLDTESPQYNERDAWRLRPQSVEKSEWLEATFHNGVFSGRPIENDRGPMTCTLMAAKALKSAGISLNGHLYITASPGEIGPEQVEEFKGSQYLGKEVGAHHLLSHGGVAPDFAIAAEGTDFGITWLSCGHILYRIDLFGEEIFTPMITHPEHISEHPNPLVKVAKLIEVLQCWAIDYEKQHTYRTKGGKSIPKAQISAIRGGDPHIMGAGSEVCSLYIEVNLTAQQSIAPIQRSLEKLLADNHLEGQVLPLVYRQGHEASDEQIAPLVDAIGYGMLAGKSAILQEAHYAYASMWRDHNVFNMYRIPACTFGPSRFQPTLQDMLDATAIYAFTAWKICNSEN